MGDAFCNKCGTPVENTDESTQQTILPIQNAQNEISQPLNQTDGSQQANNNNNQNNSNDIVKGLIVLAIIVIIVFFGWKAIKGVDFSKIGDKINNDSKTNEIKQIINDKKSDYSIVGTWEGYMLGGIAEINITDSGQCTIIHQDDFYNYTTLIEAELTKNNVIKMYSATSDGHTEEFPETLEINFLAINDNQAILISKKDYKEIPLAKSGTIGHKTSTGDGVLGNWEFSGDKIGIIEIEFTDLEKCDVDLSGKCFKTLGSDIDESPGFYDDNFIYTRLPSDIEKNEPLYKYAGGLYGIMYYELNANNLTIYPYHLYNKIK